MVDPELLRRVFEELAAEQGAFRGDPRLERYRDRLLAIDGTIWAALPRMAWAVWRQQHNHAERAQAARKVQSSGGKTRRCGAPHCQAL